jgi:hypothetical protein
VFALLIDLLSPLLISMQILPTPTRYLSQIALASLGTIVYARMMTQNYVPGAIWAIMGVSFLCFSKALLEGQPFATTLWGWWETFEFVFVAFYLYLSKPTQQFPRRLFQFCTVVLFLQVALQTLQYLGGEPIGDDLAGTFGDHGAAPLFLFSALITAWAFGFWLTQGARRNTLLGIILLLGIVANVMAENKAFLISTCAFAGTTIAVASWRTGQFWRLIPYSMVLLMTLAVFVIAYNYLVPTAERSPIEEYFLDSESREQYLNRVKVDTINGGYYLGRSSAVEYGWTSLTSGDLSTLLFGLGIGARTESERLGLIGIGLQRGDLGLNRGTSLLVFMEETGLVGLTILSIAIGWLIVELLRQTKLSQSDELLALRYGLLFFSLLWPLWLWYIGAWNTRVTMLLYWAAIGYVFNHAYRPDLHIHPRIKKQITSVL